jgi:hypothetical protein
MIRERQTDANPWAPSDFGRFADYYPATEWAPPMAQLDRTQEFAARWSAIENQRLPAAAAVVLTPGLLAEWLPTCFRAARRAFAADGHRVLQTPTRTSRGVRAQAAVLTERILAWLQPHERFIWCAHSKGGLEALWSLDASADLRARCAGVVVVQPPVGSSRLVDRWLGAPATLGDRARGYFLRSRLCREGARDASSDRDPVVSEWLEAFRPAVPTLLVVSWSVRATSWTDSYHGVLNSLRPGHAHDGQFYLRDQRLPATPIIGLAELDHAQPVLGGGRLDSARLWRALASCAWRETRRPAAAQ